MNFLSNLWGGVKTAASNIASNVAAGAKKVYNAFSNAAGTSYANVYSANEISNPPLTPYTPAPQQTIQQALTRPATPPLGQVMTQMPSNPYQTPLTGNQYQTQAPQSTIQNALGGQGTSSAQPGQSGQSSQYTPYSPYTPYTPPQETYSASPDRVYSAAEMEMLAPKTSNVQVSPMSAYAQPTYSNPLLAIPRLAPFSGFSSFNGVTSAAGGASPFPITQTSDSEEQQKRNSQTSIRGQQVMSPYIPGLTAPMPSSMTAFGFTPKPFNVPSAPTKINAGELVAAKQKNEPIISGMTSQNDFADLVGGIQTGIQQNYQKVSAQNPIPIEPVIETPDQRSYLDQFQPQERINIQQVMDDFRRQLNLPQMQQQQLDLQNQMNAVNQTFSQIYDDILKNPNIPKGLAQRRIQEAQSQHKLQIDQLSGQLQIAAQQISNANQLINQQFQIASSAVDEDARRRQENFNLLKFYTDSGAIASFTNDDIARWSQSTGIPVGQLTAIKNASGSPDVKIVEGNDGAFYKQTIGRNGQVSMTRITDPISSPTTGTGTDMTPKQYSAFLSITSKVQGDKYINNLYDAIGSNEIADQVIANPNSATNQLKSLYTLVKRLDPDSAVREGELDLAGTTASSLQKFGTYATRIIEGQTINPKVAVEMAQAVKELSKAWEKTAQKRLQSYRAQSIPAGIGTQFEEYVSGSGINSLGSQGAAIDEISNLDDGSPVEYDGKTYYKYGDELRSIDELFSPYTK